MTKKYMTVVIELPNDVAAANVVAEALPLFGNFHGGVVTAVYAGDAITASEIYESCANRSVVKIVRELERIKAGEADRNAVAGWLSAESNAVAPRKS